MAVLGALCNMDLRCSLSWRLGALTVRVPREYPIKDIHSLDSDMVSRLSMLGRNFSIQFGHTMVECPFSKNPQKYGFLNFMHMFNIALLFALSGGSNQAIIHYFKKITLSAMFERPNEHIRVS